MSLVIVKTISWISNISTKKIQKELILFPQNKATRIIPTSFGPKYDSGPRGGNKPIGNDGAGSQGNINVYRDCKKQAFKNCKF